MIQTGHSGKSADEVTIKINSDAYRNLVDEGGSDVISE